MNVIRDVSGYRTSAREIEMREAIIDLVTRQGGFVFHIRDSRGAPEMVSFPDLVIVQPNRGVVSFVELKSQSRRVTPGQAEVMAALEVCARAEAWIVRPEPKTEGEMAYGTLLNWLAT